MKKIIARYVALIFTVGLFTTMVVFRWHWSLMSAQPGISHQNDYAKNKSDPLLVLIEYNSWSMVIGSDSPTFALYDDGTVIYLKSDGRNARYVSAKLNDEERSQFLQRINEKEFGSLNSRYEPAKGITDQPEYLIIQRRADRTYKAVYLYGSLRKIKDTDALSMGLPVSLVNAFQVMSNYDNPNASECLPEYVEVMIWPYGYAPDKNLAWPKGWPGLNDPKTLSRGDNSYSLFIEKTKFPELKSFLSRIRGKQAVRIDGKKWAVSARFPFPNEDIWMKIKTQLN